MITAGGGYNEILTYLIMVIHVKNLILVCVVFLSFTGVSQDEESPGGDSVLNPVGGNFDKSKMNELTFSDMELILLERRKIQNYIKELRSKDGIDKAYDELYKQIADQQNPKSKTQNSFYVEGFKEMSENNPELAKSIFELENGIRLRMNFTELNKKLNLPLTVSEFDRQQKLYQEFDRIDVLSIDALPFADSFITEKMIKNQQEFEKQNLLEVIAGDSCIYKSSPKTINLNSRSCNKSICSSEITCNLNEKFWDFHVSCESLSRGTCPSALDCATDGLVTTGSSEGGTLTHGSRDMIRYIESIKSGSNPSRNKSSRGAR